MIEMLHFATLVFTTLFAAAAAAGLHWMLLRTMFVLMRPATARQRALQRELLRGTAALAQGTAQLARAYASQR